ncbi:unnamed protein product [Rhizophagus irregularis]|uniref:Serine protease n=1 Tax=Rhizophagus irregularis TaxID=588596 RepID=A0A2I1HCD0_9GLOM|nr:hypothetical protein RhiirA4_476917 [Rhizophagus irregularis]CAB4427254.1 unnamed protein product [Rhizophagus irregularis]
MNKKSTLYLLFALIAIMAITDSSYATPISKYEETLAYWTPERMKSAKSLVRKNVGFRNKKRNDVKTTRDAKKGTGPESAPPSEKIFEYNGPYQPTGMLFFTDPDTGGTATCTASVINTPNGNIGITAGHCLIDSQGRASENLMFSPGYDHGQDGKFGRIPVVVFQVQDNFRSNYDNKYDYDIGWKINIGNNVETTVTSYSTGNIQNCPNDSHTYCIWRGETKLTNDGFYAAPPGVNFGNGASGSPWVWNYDSNTNVGYLFGSLTSFDQNSQESLHLFII